MLLLAVPLIAGQNPRSASVIATITDKHGNAPDLPSGAKIDVVEEGKQLQSTAAQKLNGPILYVVMVDSSGSADDTPMRHVVKELPDFFQRVLRPEDRVTIIGFS